MCVLTSPHDADSLDGDDMLEAMRAVYEEQEGALALARAEQIAVAGGATGDAIDDAGCRRSPSLVLTPSAGLDQQVRH